jgi:predicted GIY-YIG superfamily endonuclease
MTSFFDVGFRISWWDFYLAAELEGFPLDLYYYTGIVRHIVKDDVYIELEDPSETRIRFIRTDKRTLAYKVHNEEIEQAILATIPEDEYTVYGLVDRQSPTIFEYIGCTSTPERRYKEHLACLGTNEEKNAWTRKVLARGAGPDMIPIEQIKGAKKAFARERYWTAYHNPRLNRRKVVRV